MNYLKTLVKLYAAKRNVNKSRESILKLQNKKLRKILYYAFDHSKYYRSEFEKFGIKRSDISKLPIDKFPKLNKEKLITNFDELVTTSELTQDELRVFDENSSLDTKLYKNKYHIVHSSGSTGRPSYFVYDENAWNEMLVGIIRAALWNMTMKEILEFLKNKPKILYIAATDGRYGGAMAVGEGIENVKAEQLFLDINMPISEWIEKIKEFKPNFIIGYPSAVKILAEYIKEKNIKLEVIRLISCGEPIDRVLRKYFEDAFGCKVLNFYGASESLALGVEIDSREGMCLFDDMNYVEIEEDGIYITSLYNFVQPLIRYKLTDRLKIKTQEKEKNENEIKDKTKTKNKCKNKNKNKNRTDSSIYISNNSFTKIESLVGRNEDMLWFTDKNKRKEFLHPLAIEGFCIEGLLDYQFKKLSEDSFEMIAESTDEKLNDEISNQLKKQMQKILESKNLKFVKFDIRFVNEILPDKETGKKKLIV